LAQHLRKRNETLLISFSRQYPRWLFPGKDDKDPSRYPLKIDAEFLLDPLSPLSWRSAIKRIEGWGADAVIIPWWVPFWAPAWSVVGRGVKKLPHELKLIFICHNVLPHEQSVLDRFALRMSLSPADGFIVHTQADAKVLQREFPEKKILVAVHPTYAGLGGDSTQPLNDLPKERPLLLFCGFVRPYKGLDILIDALALVRQEFEAHLIVAGEFWDGELKYINQIKNLGLESNVSIVNRYLPDEELVAYVDSADVVVLPYRSATQSGIVQVAFGRQKAVITTNVGGLAEVVEDGRSGFVVPPEDPHALAAAIVRYFEEEMGPRFSKYIAKNSDRFEWDQLIEKLFALTTSA
jgi:glycosyltransferase involved in cell wall biosynthesis